MTRRATLTIAGALLVLTWLLFESRGPDQAGQARVQSLLQAIELHDAELNREILLARAGLLPHYDSVTSLSRTLTADVEALRASLATLRQPSFEAERRTLAATVTRKLRLMDDVKSDNAVLRNAIAYFGRLRQGSPMGPESVALSQAVLHLISTPAPDVTKDAETELARVSVLSRHRPDLEPLAAQGGLVIALVPRLDASLGEIAAAPVAAQADTLRRALLDAAGRTDARAQRFRVAMYLVALLLLGYVVFQVARLRARTHELRRHQMQLIQANKMTSLGLLVSGVAHEVNNPNQLILTNASVLSSAWDDVQTILQAHRREEHDVQIAGLSYDEALDTMPTLIRQVRDGARRIDRIIGDLKDFARPGPRLSERVQLNDVVERATRLLTLLIQQRTDRFQITLSPAMPPMHGDRQQLEQVVVNLVINALEALRDRSGAVTVATAFDPEAGTVSVEVRDDGAGIAAEDIARLGQPFFTTKAERGGTGLGLAISTSLVRLHNGRLRFVSEPGQGTRAIVEFPAIPVASQMQTPVLHGSLP